MISPRLMFIGYDINEQTTCMVILNIKVNIGVRLNVAEDMDLFFLTWSSVPPFTAFSCIHSIFLFLLMGSIDHNEVFAFFYKHTHTNTHLDLK